MGYKIKVKRIPLVIKIAPLFLALVFFIIGYTSNATYLKNKPYFIKIDAKISKIVVEEVDESVGVSDINDRNMEERRKIVHTVYIDYTVDGKSYSNVEYSQYKIGMKEGDVIKIYYDSRNPEKIYSTTNTGLLIMKIAIGVTAIYLLIAVAVIIKTKGNRSKLSRNSECHSVKIVGLVDERLADIDYDLDDKFCPQYARIKVLYNEAVYYSDVIKYSKEIRTGDEIKIYLDKDEMERNKNSRVAKFRKTDNRVSNYYLDLKSFSSK